MVNVVLLLQLVFIHLVLGGMCVLIFGVPDTILDSVHPVFKSLRVPGRFWKLLLVHPVSVVACCLLLKLSIHVLPSVPVNLSTTRQRLSTVNGNDLTSHFDAALKKQTIRHKLEGTLTVLRIKRSQTWPPEKLN